MVDTPEGRQLRIIRGPASAAAVACELAATDAIEWPYEPIYSGAVRYQRENTRGHAEDWKDADRLIRDGYGDCEDLASARSAELVMSGVDPDARPVVYRPRPGLMHVVVRRGDGSIEDPARVLGMGNMGRIGLQSRRLRRGTYEVGLSIPFAGTKIATIAQGTSRADAARQAFEDAIGFLDEVGAWGELAECGYSPPDALEVGLERMGDADFEAWVAGAKKKVDELRSEYGVVTSRVLGALTEIDWSEWKTNPNAFTAAIVDKIQALVGSVPGPAGPVLSWLMEFGVWLAGKYPAYAIMVWQEAFVQCAKGLGYTEGDDPTKVGTMIQDGWICFDAQLSGSKSLKPDDAPERSEDQRGEMEEVLASVLCPILIANANTIRIVGRGVEKSKGLSSWMEGIARARTLLDADAVRLVEVQSKTGTRHNALCFKLAALPADMIDQLALYAPLLGAAAEIKSRGLDPNPPDEGVRRVLNFMGGGGFDASGGGQGFTGLNRTFYLKVLSDLRPGGTPQAPYTGAPAVAFRRGVRTAAPIGRPAAGKAGKTDWSALLLPAAALGALALMVAGDEPPRIPVSPTRRQSGGIRTTGGRGPRMAADDERGAFVPENPPALTPDTADRIAMMDAVAGAMADGDRTEVRRLTRGKPNLVRFARALDRG